MTSFADQLWEDAGAPLTAELNGVSVILQRGTEQTEPITAVADEVAYQVADSEGFVTTLTVRDYTLAKPEVVLDGSEVEPRPGDRILETINGVDHVYEVLPIGNEPAVRLEPSGFRYLVHTKRVQ